MRDLRTSIFQKSIQMCIEEKVDFVLICGDLFNTAIPGIDVMKEAVVQFRKLKEAGIALYVIPGSHDYSPSGKTILDVLEEAQLCINVFRGTVVDGKLYLRLTHDNKTGAKLCGILGKRSELETQFYDMLDLESLEHAGGTKIFLFHSPIEEFKVNSYPMDGVTLSQFPKGFAYYAGGHVHTVMQREEKGYGMFAYPGPLLPNSFSEFEELGGGGFYIVTLTDKVSIEWKSMATKTITKIALDADGCTAQQVSEKLLIEANDKEVDDAIVLIRIEGMLISGSVADISFREATDLFYRKGAFFVMRSTTQLESKDLVFMEGRTDSVEQIEQAAIEEHAAQIELPGELKGSEKRVLAELLAALSAEKAEGETLTAFEGRLIEAASRILRLR